MPDIQLAGAAVPLPSAEINLGGVSTSELQFLTASAQNGVASGSVLTAYIPGSNVMKNRPLQIRAGGRVNAAGNVTFKLYTGNSTTLSNNTNIATSGAKAAGAGSNCNWGLEIIGAIDSTSNTINGLLFGWVGGAATITQAVLTNTATITLANASSTLPLSVTATFATGAAANVAYVDWFEVITN